jgi:hypothetical protein
MPNWLPPMAQVNPWTPDKYEMLYAIFCRDIRDSNLQYRGCRVWIYRKLEDGKEEIFWHLTSREVKPTPIPRRQRHFFPAGQTHLTQQRTTDPKRCERLPWIKPLIQHPTDPEVLAWDYLEGDGSVKTYVWLKAENFVVIMKKLPDGQRRLVTSFYVDEEYKRKDFERKYANRQQN